MNAYWVVYVNDDVAEELACININTYSVNESNAVDRDHVYSQRLSGALNMLVEEDNKKFKDEISDYQTT